MQRKEYFSLSSSQAAQGGIGQGGIVWSGPVTSGRRASGRRRPRGAGAAPALQDSPQGAEPVPGLMLEAKPEFGTILGPFWENHFGTIQPSPRSECCGYPEDRSRPKRPPQSYWVTKSHEPPSRHPFGS